MKISLRIRIKPLDLDSMDSDELKAKAQKIFDTILQLETDKYDYEQRQLDQVRLSLNASTFHDLHFSGLRAEGAGREAKAAAEEQGDQEGS